MKKKEKKGKGMWKRIKLMNGELKKVREEKKKLVLGNVKIERKMGFKEVIMKGDVRNEMYMKMVCGELYKGRK